jgi:hypothetical protein
MEIGSSWLCIPKGLVPFSFRLTYFYDYHVRLIDPPMQFPEFSQ